MAVASVALTGCLFSVVPGSATVSAAPSVAPDTDGVSAELLPFYSQHVTWSACEKSGFDCAQVSAPLDWNDPGRGKVTLALIRHRASGGAPLGTIFTDPGGPGESGYAFVRDSSSYGVGSDAAQRYDVVGFDPRGVGRSSAVTCFDAADMDSYLFDIQKGPRNSEAWEAEELQSDRGFAEACEKNSRGILPYITTEFAARDLDLMRALLGQKKLNYLGYSYGTLLGATYAGLYPKNVGRMVLDGALDPTSTMLDVSVAQAHGFETSLRAYAAACVAGRNCPFTGTADDAMSDIGAMLAAVDRDPVKNRDGRLLGADSLMTAIVATLYSQQSWPYLSQMFTGVKKGDPSLAFQLADFYYNRTAGAYSDNSTEAFTAYNCLDYPNNATPAQLAAATAQIARESPTVAPYWNVYVNICDVWPATSDVTLAPITAKGASPIVVIGSTGDPATPYAWAQALAGQLASGVLITRVGEGHTGFDQGNSCVDSAVNAYLIRGTTPDDGLRCPQ